MLTAYNPSKLIPLFEQARHALTEAKTANEVKRIRDQAQAIQAYLHQQRASLGMINDATEIKLRAERRLGEMLAETVTHEGGRPKLSHHGIVSNGRLPEGVTLNQSSRWQQLAVVPEERFEALLAEIKGKQERLTTNGILRELNTRAHAKHWSGTLANPHPLIRLGLLEDPCGVVRRRKKIASQLLTEYSLRASLPHGDTHDHSYTLLYPLLHHS